MNTPSKRSGLVWGGLLIVLGILALLETITDLSPWIWVAILVIGGLGVFAFYVTDRTEKWLLIIAYAMLAVAGLVTLLELDLLRDAYVATYVLLAIGLPFFVAFLNNRSNWGLLIPAYVLLVIGVFVPLTEFGVLNDSVVVTYILFAIAIPFFVVFLRNTKNWWALIPGGILSIVGLGFLISEASVGYVFAAVMIVAGILILVRQLTKGEEAPQMEELPREELQDA
jgi:hypothetical protein